MAGEVGLMRAALEATTLGARHVIREQKQGAIGVACSISGSARQLYISRPSKGRSLNAQIFRRRRFAGQQRVSSKK